MNKNDTVLMLEGINEDTKQGLRGWILLGTPENTGDGPARVPLANNEVITGDPCWHPWGVGASTDDMLPRILVTDADGAPLASRVGTGAEQWSCSQSHQ